MEYHTFFAFNVIGGVLWGTLLLFSGYFVGQYVPNAGHYLEWIIIAIILLSILPIAIEYYRVRKK